MTQSNQVESTRDLAKALAECMTYAKRGHALASDALMLLNRVVRTVSDKVQENIIDLTKSKLNDTATSKSLTSQLS